MTCIVSNNVFIDHLLTNGLNDLTGSVEHVVAMAIRWEADSHTIHDNNHASNNQCDKQSGYDGSRFSKHFRDLLFGFGFVPGGGKSHRVQLCCTTTGCRPFCYPPEFRLLCG